jgi:hypothetical protein
LNQVDIHATPGINNLRSEGLERGIHSNGEPCADALRSGKLADHNRRDIQK